MELNTIQKNKITLKGITIRSNKMIGMIIICGMMLTVFQSCGDDEKPSTELQTVEFTFGPDQVGELRPTTNIAKAGADKNVGKIKIKSDGKNWGGANVSTIAGKLLDPAFEAANGKGTGDNTKLNGLYINNKSDSIRLADVYGYIFENCYVAEH